MNLLDRHEIFAWLFFRVDNFTICMSKPALDQRNIANKKPRREAGVFCCRNAGYLIELIRLWHCVTVTFSPQVAI